MKKKSKYSYYKSMENKYPPRNGWPPIPWVLEIRLCQDTWKKIRQVATVRNETYSRVVRYAVFRLIRRRNLRKYLGLDSGSETALLKYNALTEKAKGRRENFRIKHRHILCLYGDDEIMIRLAATQLRCTMTHLVRLALEYRLDEMLATKLCQGKSPWFLEWSWHFLGSKLYSSVELKKACADENFFKHIPFQKGDYW